MKIAPIDTSRLTLRGFTKDDALFAISIWNDREMGEYLPDPAEEDMDAEYRRSIEVLGDDATCCYLIAVLRETGERIGTCSFMPLDGGAVYDIAYCVHKTRWHNGFATEIARGMMEYARSQGAKLLTAVVNKENGASNAIVRKLGMSVVGERSYLKKGTDITFHDYKYEMKL